jgi:hypothetical protein
VKSKADDALIFQVAWQRRLPRDARHRLVKGGIEAGDLLQVRQSLTDRLDAGDGLREMSWIHRDQAGEIADYIAVDHDRR